MGDKSGHCSSQKFVGDVDPLKFAREKEAMVKIMTNQTLKIWTAAMMTAMTNHTAIPNKR